MKLLVAAVFATLALAGCLEDPDGFVPRGCPASVVLEDTLDIGNTVGGARVGSDTTWDLAVPVGERTGWSTSDARCVRAIEVHIAWTNNGNEGADLFVGVQVPGSSEVVQGHDEQQFVGDGRHMESVLIPTSNAPGAAADLLDGVRVVVGTEWAALTPDSIPVDVTVTLHVDF